MPLFLHIGHRFPGWSHELQLKVLVYLWLRCDHILSTLKLGWKYFGGICIYAGILWCNPTHIVMPFAFRTTFLKCLKYLYLFEFLHHFQHCTGQITMGSFVGRGNQYIPSVKVLYCKLPTIGKQLPTSPCNVRGLNRQPKWCEVSVLPLHHHGPFEIPLMSLCESMLAIHA